MPELSLVDYSLIGLCALLIGMTKTGFAPAYPIVVPIMTFVFGAKASTGIIVPCLIFADFFAVRHYRKEVNWRHVWRMIIPTFVGIGIGVWLGNMIDDVWFKHVMAIILSLSAGVLIWMEYRKSTFIPDYLWFAILIGIIAGFSTMVGNISGPITTIYFLAMRLPKNAFIGTSAWFYVMVNNAKLPFHIFVWETISWDTFFVNLQMFPFVAIGAFIGIWVVKLFTEDLYRQLIIATTVLSAVLLMI